MEYIGDIIMGYISWLVLRALTWWPRDYLSMILL